MRRLLLQMKEITYTYSFVLNIFRTTSAKPGVLGEHTPVVTPCLTSIARTGSLYSTPEHINQIRWDGHGYRPCKLPSERNVSLPWMYCVHNCGSCARQPELILSAEELLVVPEALTDCGLMFTQANNIEYRIRAGSTDIEPQAGAIPISM